MVFGVTPDGFSQKELGDIKGEIEADLRASFGPQINLQADSVFGQIVGTFSDKVAELWEVLGAVYRSQFPDSASDEALDNVAAITGATRLSESTSKVTLNQIFLDGGTTLPVGRIVGVGAAGNRFVTTAAVTNAAGYKATVSVEAESEQGGPVTGFAGTIDTIVTPVTGWSAKAALTAGTTETYALSDGLTLTVKVDGGAVQTATFNTADFAAIGAATAAEVAAVIATDIVGASCSDEGGAPRIESDTAGSGSSIEVTGGTANGILGFSTSIVKGFNSADANLGRALETDAELRLRREQLLRATGNATVEAIRARVLGVLGVDEAFVFENDDLITNGDGVPGKAFETVIRGPAATDEDVAQAIFDTKPAGIEAYGTTIEPITDSQGFVQSIGFSRATEIDIYIAITVTKNTDPSMGPTYPIDGDAQVKAALAAKVDSFGVGRTVIAEQVKCEAFQVPGVVDVTAFAIDDAPGPTLDDNIPIASREIAIGDTSKITVS